MKTDIALVFTALALLASGCSTAPAATDKPPAANSPSKPQPVAPIQMVKVETTSDGASTSGTLEDYKRDLAQRIVQVNSTKVYVERPQALLRSVIVIKYFVDANGHLTHSEIIRSNHDHATEATALASLHNTAPFPKPSPHLLRHGRAEISETWLFNNDGRFQLRTLASQQMGE